MIVVDKRKSTTFHESSKRKNTFCIVSILSPFSACDFDLSLPLLLLPPGVLGLLVGVAPRGRMATSHVIAKLIIAVGPVLTTLNLTLDVFGAVFLGVAF